MGKNAQKKQGNVQGIEVVKYPGIGGNKIILIHFGVKLILR